MSINVRKDFVSEKLDREVEGQHEWSLPPGYEFQDENGNRISASKIVLKKIKPPYPITIAESCKVLGVDHASVITGYMVFPLAHLQALLVCRDAYWKIAGEEMGLDGPWKPDYDSGVDKFGIICMNGVVQRSNPTTNWERHLNKVLDFPTKKMRDMFAACFTELIESCKEMI